MRVGIPGTDLALEPGSPCPFPSATRPPTRPRIVLLVLAVLAGSAAGTAAQAPGPAAAIEARAAAERLRAEGRLPEALAAYRNLVALDSTGFEDRFWLAKLESWTGGVDAAERAFVALLAERPDDYDSRIALADVRRWRGDTAGAREALEPLASARPHDPEVRSRLAALAPSAQLARWEADVRYLGERLTGGGHGDAAALSLRPLAHGRIHWLAAVTVQDKFQRTEARAGGELGVRLAGAADLTGSVFLAPGAEVLPRWSYGVTVARPLARGLVVGAAYAFDGYHDAGVHGVGPTVELYAGHWFVAGRYRYAATRFEAADAAVGEHAGMVTVGRAYGPANLFRLFVAAGGEAFSQPARDRIGRLDAWTIGAAWRHYVSQTLGLETTYARQDRSGGGVLHSYGLRVVRRW